MAVDPLNRYSNEVELTKTFILWFQIEKTLHFTQKYFILFISFKYLKHAKRRCILHDHVTTNYAL